MLRIDVPTPADVGLPYEDVTITTSDKVKVKGYVIPARRTYISTPEIQRMSPEERVKRAAEETEKWAEEVGTDEAVKVGTLPCRRLYHLLNPSWASHHCSGKSLRPVHQITTYCNHLSCQCGKHGTPCTHSKEVQYGSRV